MKKSEYYIVFTLFLGWLGIISCNDKEEIVIGDRYICLFSTIQQPDFRISGNSFEENDQIGVFVVPYQSDDITPGILGESDYANNIQHTYQASSWLTNEGVLLPWPGDRNIDVYAYYPYNEELQDARDYRFSVSTDQTTLNGYLVSDFLYARNLGVSPSASVPLLFSHGLSKININIKSEITSVQESLQQTSVFIQNIIPDCQIDLANDGVIIPADALPAEISTFMLTAPVTNYDLSLTAIIPPPGNTI